MKHFKSQPCRLDYVNTAKILVLKGQPTEISTPGEFMLYG